MGRDTLEQYTLFDMEEEENEVDDITTHQCKECKKIKPIRSFNTKKVLTPYKKEGTPYPVRRNSDEGGVQLFALFNTCRSCDAIGRAGRHARERLYGKPAKDYCCPLCTRNEEQIRNSQVVVDKDYNVYKRNLDISVWQLDHDHKTEKFRGWLCKKCNTGLGNFGDSIEGLKKAIRYLEGDSNDSKRI